MRGEGAGERKPGVSLWRYTRPFELDGRPAQVVIRSAMSGLFSELQVDGRTVASDWTPPSGPAATRNHRLVHEDVEVEAGYVSLWNIGIAVRRGGALVHESHPGQRIAFPAKLAKMASDPGIDMARYKANTIPITIDIVLGLLFFVVAKLTDLSTAAIVGAGVGIALVIVQRFVKVDLVGGLALFGVVMLLISAGLAIAFQDDWAVKMRTSIVGVITAVLFLGDGLLGGNRLGKGLARYLPYRDMDPARLALGMGVLGLVMAGLNYLVAAVASTDVWLFYTTFVDFFLVMLLIVLVLRYARKQPLLPRARR
ncbi:MAG TPA: septation protein IspZ [Allosphingosinicella sp.]|jgi:intracellular septation protein A